MLVNNLAYIVPAGLKSFGRSRTVEGGGRYILRLPFVDVL